MFDEQTGVVALGAVCGVVLFVVLPLALIEAHTGRRTLMSRFVSGFDRDVPRRSLLIEIPAVVILVAGSQLVMAAVVVSPESMLLTRLIGLVELIACAGWLTYLIRWLRNDPV